MIHGEIKILKEVVEAVVHKITVKRVEIIDLTAKIYTCNTLYLNVGKIVTINAVKYRVVEFIINQYILVKPVKGSTLPPTNTTEFIIDDPKFYDGTPRRVTAENTMDKQVPGYNVPIIWLLMWVEIKGPEDKRSSYIRSTIEGANLFFLDDCNVKDWNQEDHRVNIWEPMENEMWHIFKALEKRPDIFHRDINEPDRRFHSNFGEYLTNKGYDGTILAGTFSGVQAILDIPYIIDPCGCDAVEVCKPVRFLINGETKQDIASGTDFDLTVENESGGDPVISYDTGTKTLIVSDGGGGSTIAEVTNSDGTFNDSFDTANNPYEIPNSTFVFNDDDDVSPLPATLEKTIDVYNNQSVKVGTKVVDTPTTLVILAPDATVNVQDSDGNLLFSQNISSGSSDSPQISDSVVTNSNSTYSLNVLAQGSEVLPDTTINVVVNGVAETPQTFPTLTPNQVINVNVTWI